MQEIPEAVPGVVHEHTERSVSEMCRALPQDLVEHRPVGLGELEELLCVRGQAELFQSLHCLQGKGSVGKMRRNQQSR